MNRISALEHLLAERSERKREWSGGWERERGGGRRKVVAEGEDRERTEVGSGGWGEGKEEDSGRVGEVFFFLLTAILWLLLQLKWFNIHLLVQGVVRWGWVSCYLAYGLSWRFVCVCVHLFMSQLQGPSFSIMAAPHVEFYGRPSCHLIVELMHVPSMLSRRRWERLF